MHCQLLRSSHAHKLFASKACPSSSLPVHHGHAYPPLTHGPHHSLCVQLLWAEGGIRRFYKGFAPCIIRAAPANGVMLLTVDKVSTLLNA